MTTGLIIASSGLEAIAAGALTLRRHREQSIQRTLAGRHGWEVCRQPEDELLAILRGSALMQIGHSRRLAATFRGAGQTWLFAYVFETGFEHRRRSHDWRMTVCAVPYSGGRVTITQLDWLAATAAGPATSELPLSCETGAAPGPAASLIAIVEDPQDWRRRLNGNLVQWLHQQPTKRSWEILPGHIVGYEPGRADENALADLESAIRELADLLSA